MKTRLEIGLICEAFAFVSNSDSKGAYFDIGIKVNLKTDRILRRRPQRVPSKVSEI